MNYSVYSYTWTARELKRVIVSLLKSGSAINVQKLNYVQDFVLNEWWKVVKTEEKLVMICTNDELKLSKFLEKNPQLKKITLS
jgi:hypothetical protein